MDFRYCSTVIFMFSSKLEGSSAVKTAHLPSLLGGFFCMHVFLDEF